MISRLLSPAAALGVAAAFALAAPAAAATTPTLSGPAQRTGYGTITLTGTADPGASVHLYETAIGINDMQPANDWEHGGGTVTATADSAGKFSIVRYLDSGFYFNAESGGVHSARITVRIKFQPTFWVTSPAAGTIQADTAIDPNADGITVHVQRQSGSTWTTVATGKTANSGNYVTRMTGLPTGTYTYRAVIDADPNNGGLGNTSPAASTHVTGASGGTPAAGAVQFTRIQYNSPGTDTGSNTSLNAEWAELTNKTGTQLTLTGWTLRDAAGHVYTFTGTVHLNAGASLFVHTGKGTNTATHRYWSRTGTTGYIWNNSGDTAYLRTPTNKTIDTCKWTTGTGATNC